MRKPMFFVLVTLLLSLAVASGGCTGNNNGMQPAALADTVVSDAVLEADPGAAATAILENYEDRVIQTLNDAELLSLTGINPDDTSYYLAYYSDPDNGLCDMIFIQPIESERDQLREALYAFKESRVDQFQNYDILDSLKIAENAIVLDQGDYLVLLMLPNNDEAQEIIDLYIPQ